ncbi:MAG TPA: agmatinase [Clostridiales bacterium]|nr:agmatinase [Clostridiales bacterium]
MTHQQQPDFSVLGLRFMACEASYDQAAVILFGAPWDGTVSFRPGSRFGPADMRQDSLGLETYSPYQDLELPEDKVRDIGDLELPMGGRDASLERIGATVATVLAAGKKPVMLGGEHLVSLPAVVACLAKWPDLCVLHFDAHADLREEYLGETLSHATVMRRIWNKLGDGRIWQLGIRSGTADEFAFARAGHVTLHPFDCEGLPAAVAAIGDRPVYLSIDLDVLDPSTFPGTGTPEPGGITFLTLLRALLQLRGMNIVGADLVELAPHYDASGVSTAVALKLLRELLILL